MDPEKTAIPYDRSLTKIQKLILLRIFRPDRILNAVTKFITDKMGSKFTEPPAFSLATSFLDSSPHIPLIFILSSGIDPFNHLYRLSEEKNMKDKIYSISLGQGQGPIALRAIEDGLKNGFWIILQNCHLCVSFLSELEKVCTDVSKNIFIFKR